jgi:DNA polymerase-3 subunit alpha
MWIASSKKIVGQYDLDAVEDMGLMKQDFLGLNCLDTIEECVNLIDDRTGVYIDPDEWVPGEEPRDEEIWAMLAKGDCDGVFQMEGATNRRGCIEVQPKNFEDVVSITSLYRTGPIRAGYPKIFNANRKKSRNAIPYATPMLKPILERTWGVILYQEQVMEIGEKLAGFDQVQVDDIKEAIKHKKSALMESMKPLFVKGCKKTNGISKEVSERIWQDIEGYSGYSYNRSHAVAYTMLTYQMARFKLLYPLDFYAAHLRTVDTSNPAGKEKRVRYLQSVVRRGYDILPPAINISGRGATPDHEAGAIRMGLVDIKGVGEAAASKILAKGRLDSIDEVREAANNSGVLGVLEACSALDALGGQGDRARTNELLGWDFYDELKKLRKKYKKQIVLPAPGVREVCILGEVTKIVTRETASGKPYVTWTLKYSAMESYSIRLWSECKKLFDLKEGSVVLVKGKWEPKWENCSVGTPKDVKIIDAKYEEF